MIEALKRVDKIPQSLYAKYEEGCRKEAQQLIDGISVCLSSCLFICLSICLSIFVVRVFAHGAMGRRVDPSWGGPIELFLVPASAP